MSTNSYSDSYSSLNQNCVDLNQLNVEFRVHKINFSKNQRWFMSFFNRHIFKEYLHDQNINIQNIIIHGSFFHENFSGESFFLENTIYLNPLDKAYQEQNLYSIWDFVSCKKGKICLLQSEKKYFFKVFELDECSTQWDD